MPLLYLGSADDLLNRLLQAPRGELRIRSFQHGDVAALKAAADRLQVVSIIDRHVPEAARGLSVGTTLLLAALNRAIRPRSKRGWAAWAQLTSLHRLFPQVQLEQLTSQFFWDQMDCVKLEALRAIEDELTQVIVKELGIKLDTLFYDATPWGSFGIEPPLAMKTEPLERPTFSVMTVPIFSPFSQTFTSPRFRVAGAGGAEPSLARGPAMTVPAPGIGGRRIQMVIFGSERRGEAEWPGRHKI